jgi:hypothetical protein
MQTISPVTETVYIVVLEIKNYATNNSFNEEQGWGLHSEEQQLASWLE